jgi:DNA-binding PadR family transcriptional regulator
LFADQRVGREPTADAKEEPVRSTVNWAVLGLVIEKPSYGYELSQRFERRFGQVLRVGTSHIYAALNSLEKEGLIEPMPGEQGTGKRRQPKIHYRATAAGARAYRGWLGERMRDDSQRVELLGRLLATGALDFAAMLTLVGRYERECLEEASRISLPRPDEPGCEGQLAHALADRLVAEERRLALHGQLMWVEYARREILALLNRGESQSPAEHASAVA